MRRKTNKTRYFLIAILILMISGVAYSYLSTSLNISGDVKGRFQGGEFIVDSGSNKNLELTNLTKNKWQSGDSYEYHYTFNIKNNGSTNYDNFNITLTYNDEIISSQIWNYENEIQNKVLIISNKKYLLKANNYLEVSFIIKVKTSDLKLIKVKLEANTETHSADPSKMEIMFNKSNSWGNYVYQYSVSVTNKTGAVITYWQIDLTLPNSATYQSGWSAIFSSNNNVLTIKNEDYNGRIENNKTITFGLQISTSDINFVPDNYKVVVR